MKPTANELKILRDRLPRGYRKLVVTELEKTKVTVTPAYVGMVVNGAFWNEKVFAAALRVAERHEVRMNRLRRRALGTKVDA